MRGTSYALFLQLEAIGKRMPEYWEEQDNCPNGYKTRDPGSPNEKLRLVFALVVHDASVIIPRQIHETSLIQTSIDDYADKPFSLHRKQAINKQIGRAVVSANLPFSFVEDPKVQKLFALFNAYYKLPSRKWLVQIL